MVQESRPMQQRILTMPVTLAEVHCCRIPCNITALQFCSKSPQATATESSITHWISDTYVKSHLIRGPSPIIQPNPNTHGGLRSHYHYLVLGHTLSSRRTADRQTDRPCTANHLSKRAQAAFRKGSNWYIPWRTRCNQKNTHTHTQKTSETPEPVTYTFPPRNRKNGSYLIVN